MIAKKDLTALENQTFQQKNGISADTRRNDKAIITLPLRHVPTGILQDIWMLT